MRRYQIHLKGQRKSVSRTKENPLLKMAGFAKGTGKNISQNINEIYLRD